MKPHSSVRIAIWCSLCLLLLLLLSGCQSKRIINQNGFIQTVTIDRVKDEPKLFYYGITYPEFTPDGKSKTITLGIRAHDFQEAYLHFSLQTRYNLVLGQIRNIVIGKSVWIHDMKKALTNLNFQPKFPLSARLMIYDGEARELLQLNEDTTDFHLYQLMLKLQKINDFSLSTIFNYVRDDIQPGIEPVATTIRVRDQSVSVEGIAVFKDNKLASKLTEHDVNYMLLLRNQKVSGSFHVSQETLENTNKPIIIDNAMSKSTVKVLEASPVPKIMIDVDVKSTLTTALNELNANANQSLSEQQITEALEAEFNRVIHHLQELKCDAIGVGMYVRNKLPYSDWDEEQWNETFSKAEIACKVKYRMENMF